MKVRKVWEWIKIIILIPLFIVGFIMLVGETETVSGFLASRLLAVLCFSTMWLIIRKEFK